MALCPPSLLDTPPRDACAAAAGLLAVRPPSPRAKARRFVEAQRREGPAGDEPPGEEPADEMAGEKEQPTVTARKRKSRGDAANTEEKRKHNANKKKRTEAGADDQAKLLFRRSQKALRQEAQHVSVREVLCRSLSVPVDGLSETSNPFSPKECSQASAWSPSIAATLTNKFLSNVQRQKKQTFERLIQKEITNSQLSFSRSADDPASEECVPELIIGDETAVMIPPDVNESSNGFLSVDKEAHFPRGGHSAPQAVDEHDEEAEQARSQALRRKHELWRMRQRHLREQTHGVAEEPRAHRNGDSTASASAAMAATTSLTRAPPQSADAEGLHDVLMMTQRMTMQRTHSGALGISASHIDMIRRVNSFENTSSQRVVLFEARNSKQGVSKNKSHS